MSYRQHCPHCSATLRCEGCGEVVQLDDPLVGQVGKHYRTAPFDPARRNAWATQRGRILQVMYDHHPVLLVARDIAEFVTFSHNQVNTRLGELRVQGLVYWPGSEHLTKTNTPAHEVRLTELGLSLLAPRHRYRVRIVNGTVMIRP